MFNAEDEEDDLEEVDDVLTDNLGRNTLSAGYNSLDAAENNLSLIMALVGIGIVLLLIGFCAIFAVWSSKIRNTLKNLLRSIFWNSFIRMILEISLETSLGCMIEFYALKVDSVGDIFSSISSVGLPLIFLAFAVSVPFYLYKRKDVMLTETWQKKFGSLVMSMKQPDFGANLYSTFFIMRRLHLAAMIAFLNNKPWL